MGADAAPLGYLGAFKLSRSSRLRVSQFYPSLDGSSGRWPYNARSFSPHSTDVFHTVRPGEEYAWDLIAFRVYGSNFLYWVLPLANGYNDAFTGPEVGEVIRVPTLNRVLSIQQLT